MEVIFHRRFFFLCCTYFVRYFSVLAILCKAYYDVFVDFESAELGKINTHPQDNSHDEPEDTQT